MGLIEKKRNNFIATLAGNKISIEIFEFYYTKI